MFIDNFNNFTPWKKVNSEFVFSGLIWNKLQLIAFLQKCKICNEVELKVKRWMQISEGKAHQEKECWCFFSLLKRYWYWMDAWLGYKCGSNYLLQEYEYHIRTTWSVQFIAQKVTNLQDRILSFNCETIFVLSSSTQKHQMISNQEAWYSPKNIGKKGSNKQP